MTVSINKDERNRIIEEEFKNYDQLCTSGTGPDMREIFKKLFNKGFNHFHEQFINAQEEDELQEHMLRYPQYYDNDFNTNVCDVHDKF